MCKYLNLIPNLLILWIFLAYYLTMPRPNNRRNRTFRRLLILQSLVLFLDLLIEWSNENPKTLPALVMSVLCTVYCALFLNRSYAGFLFTFDILHLKEQDAPRRRRISLAVFLALEVVALSNVLHGAMVRVDGGTYQESPLYRLLSFACLFYAGLSLYLLKSFSHRLNRSELVSAIVAQAVLVVGASLHIARASSLILHTAFLIAIIILYLNFENPDLYMANRGNAFNMRAFRELMEEAIEGKTYHILAFVLRDYIDMRGIYGGQQMDKGVSMMGAFLVRTYPEYQVFYLRSGRFVLLGPESMDLEQLRTDLHERFQTPWVADDAELDLSVAFVQITTDMGLDTVDRILNYIFLAFDYADETLPNPDGLIDTDSIREIDRQVDVKRSLEHCLEQNEVEIFLQPLIDSKKRSLAGAEVLCRIRDEKGSIISPTLFVPIAEKNGCINLMGEQVLEKACQFVRDNDLDAMGLSWLNVNLSPIQCMKKDLNERFATILSQYGVSTDIIHLEITEQSVMDISRLEKQIQILRNIGFLFSLDDYGSGYSNLSRVKQYPFANIKLDMGIVWDYFRDKDTLLPTIVKAFKEMGFTITAEGIETAEMADEMSEIGCDYLQGYYFSKPLPTDEFVKKYTLLKQQERVNA